MINLACRTVRGAVTVEENSRKSVLLNTELMLSNIFESNDIQNCDIISIMFTATSDIDAVYPAVAARNLGVTEASLTCVQEMFVEGSLEMCLRVVVTVETDKKQSEMKHIYLKGAKKLRPDLNNENKFISVAIDGPAGSGKSTVAKILAKEKGYLYIDTGAMYRSVALFCIKNGVDISNSEAVAEVLPQIKIDFKNELFEQKVYLNNINVTEDIRTAEVSKGSSDVAALKCVRDRLVILQREFSQKHNVVMDGRDVGTYVIPDADVKIYMDADIEERAKRRFDEMLPKNQACDFETVKAEILERDDNDTKREFSPLKIAEDAVYIDTTHMSVVQVKNKILTFIDKKIKNRI